MSTVTTTPAARSEPYAADWLGRHDAILARRPTGPVDLLFLGDSITEGWLDDGRAVWDARFAARSVNAGIGGDETQHVLWRLDHGAVDGYAPRGVVLLIGTNNLGNSGHSADDTAAGVDAVVRSLRAKLPASRVLLLAVLPRDRRPTSEHRRSIARVNELIVPLADGDAVRYLDTGPTFLLPDGRLDLALMPDELHLSAEGYERWADAMGPTLAAMLG